MKERMRKFASKIRINDKTINFLLIFILGFLVGVAVKTEARNRVTIGYGDYLTGQMSQDFDLMKKTQDTLPGDSSGQEPQPDSGNAQELE